MSVQRRRHALGQHFLRDKAVAELIVDTFLNEAADRRTPHLLEIGPGKGAITNILLARLPEFPQIENLLLVERDQRLVKEWQQHPPYPFTFIIEEHDFVELDEMKWLGAAPLAVVSNLPYSAGTAILTRLAQHYSQITVMVLMFQTEVAKRLRADLGGRDRGSLSIWLQNRWDVRKLCAVPPQAFSPPPKVQSEVVILTPRLEPRIPIRPDQEVAWEACLKTAFAHRRKMLRSIVPWRNALATSGIDGTKRAEVLNWEEWGRLFQALQSGI